MKCTDNPNLEVGNLEISGWIKWDYLYKKENLILTSVF